MRQSFRNRIFVTVLLAILLPLLLCGALMMRLLIVRGEESLAGEAEEQLSALSASLSGLQEDVQNGHFRLLRAQPAAYRPAPALLRQVPLSILPQGEINEPSGVRLVGAAGNDGHAVHHGGASPLQVLWCPAEAIPPWQP